MMMLGLGLGLGLGACFSDSGTPPESCAEGSEGCPCLNLQCEADLVCQEGTCVSATGSAGSTGSTGASGSTSDPSSSTSDTTASDTTATVDDTTGLDSSTGLVDTCGDGILDPTEECDATPGCSKSCELESDEYGCNPINNAPCPAAFKCSVVEPGPDMVQTVCLPFASEPLDDQGEPPPGELFDSNCFFDGSPHDEWCEVGLACALSSSTDACDVNCCVEFCDLTDAAFRCQFPGDTCQAFFGPGVPVGMGHLGYCVTP